MQLVQQEILVGLVSVAIQASLVSVVTLELQDKTVQLVLLVLGLRVLLELQAILVQLEHPARLVVQLVLQAQLAQVVHPVTMDVMERLAQREAQQERLEQLGRDTLVLQDSQVLGVRQVQLVILELLDRLVYQAQEQE